MSGRRADAAGTPGHIGVKGPWRKAGYDVGLSQVRLGWSGLREGHHTAAVTGYRSRRLWRWKQHRDSALVGCILRIDHCYRNHYHHKAIIRMQVNQLMDRHIQTLRDWILAYPNPMGLDTLHPMGCISKPYGLVYPNPMGLDTFPNTLRIPNPMGLAYPNRPVPVWICKML